MIFTVKFSTFTFAVPRNFANICLPPGSFLSTVEKLTFQQLGTFLPTIGMLSSQIWQAPFPDLEAPFPLTTSFYNRKPHSHFEGPIPQLGNSLPSHSWKTTLPQLRPRSSLLTGKPCTYLEALPSGKLFSHLYAPFRQWGNYSDTVGKLYSNSWKAPFSQLEALSLAAVGKQAAIPQLKNYIPIVGNSFPTVGPGKIPSYLKAPFPPGSFL